MHTLENQEPNYLKLPKNSLWAALPIPAFKILAEEEEYITQRVFVALLLHQGKAGNCVWPSYETISHLVGVRNRNNISRSLRTLESYGFIKIAKFREGRNSRRKYYFQPATWDVSKMKGIETTPRIITARCLACTKYLSRAEYGVSGDRRAHWGCGGFVIDVPKFKYRNTKREDDYRRD